MSATTATIPAEIVAAFEKPDYLPRRPYFGDTLDEAVATALDAQVRMEKQP